MKLSAALHRSVIKVVPCVAAVGFLASTSSPSSTVDRSTAWRPSC
jgi:hypothetical protein